MHYITAVPFVILQGGKLARIKADAGIRSVRGARQEQRLSKQACSLSTAVLVYPPPAESATGSTRAQPYVIALRRLQGMPQGRAFLFRSGRYAPCSEYLVSPPLS